MVMRKPPRSDLGIDVLEVLLAAEEQPIMDLLGTEGDESLEALCELLDLQSRRTGRPIVIIPSNGDIRH
jgi:hypothetical protein